jgi:hypothetical protein
MLRRPDRFHTNYDFPHFTVLVVDGDFEDEAVSKNDSSILALQAFVM